MEIRCVIIRFAFRLTSACSPGESFSMRIEWVRVISVSIIEFDHYRSTDSPFNSPAALHTGCLSESIRIVLILFALIAVFRKPVNQLDSIQWTQCRV